MDLLSFVQEKQRKIEEMNKVPDRNLCKNSVLLRKRLRDQTFDDAFSVFDWNGRWTPLKRQAGLYSLNIVKPTIRANKSAVMTADPKVSIEPRFPKDSKTAMASEVAQAIRDIKTVEQWTPHLKEQIATEPQVAPGVFVNIDWNPYAKKQFSVDEWSEEEFEYSERVCKACGYSTEDQTCPDCGGETEAIGEPVKEKVPVEGDVKSYRSGDTKTKVIPSWEWVIDGMGTQGGNLSKAKWGLHRHLEPFGELKIEYPQISSKNQTWCDPLQWEYALSTGQEAPSDSLDPDDLTEVKDLYLTPSTYLHEEFDAYELKDGDKTRFACNGNLADSVFMGQKFDEPPVLCFRTVNNELLDVYPCDFREKNVYISFLTDPSAFWALYLTELLPLQDVVNHMFTIQMNHTRRNARTTKILNSSVFDSEDVEKDVVLTRDEAAFPFDVPIANAFGSIPASTLSSEPMMLVKTIFEVKQDIGGVTPAMMGQSSPSEPYAAQRLQKEQSLGQLTPFLQSIALGKVAWTRRQLIEAQENWSEEDFSFLLKLNGEWTDDYIEAFLKCDVDADLVLDYEQGSESPRNLLDRELALRQFMADVVALAQINPAIATPELLNDILLRIKQFSDVDVDVNNTEAETRLADSRYDKIQALIDGYQIPVGAPKEVLDIIAQSLVSGLPDLTPSMYEDPATEIEFYRDKITQELAKDAPNFLLVACCEAQIKALKMEKVQEVQEDLTLEMEAQAPLIEQQNAQMQAEQEAQMAQAQMQMEAEAQKNEQAMQMEKEKMAIEGQKRQQDMDFEREKMNMERQNKILDASIQAGAREHESTLAPKDKKK